MNRPTEQVLDELLVMAAQERQSQAMDYLVKRWYRRLWQYVRRLTGRTDATWDVTQEVWLAITRSIGRLDDPSMFRRWAFRIATNKSVDWVRSRRRKMLPLAEETPERPSQDSEDSSERIRAAMAMLPAEKRAILALKYMEDFGVREIAQILKIPEGTAKSRLFSARESLRQILEGEMR